MKSSIYPLTSHSWSFLVLPSYSAVYGNDCIFLTFCFLWRLPSPWHFFHFCFPWGSLTLWIFFHIYFRRAARLRLSGPTQQQSAP